MINFVFPLYLFAFVDIHRKLRKTKENRDGKRKFRQKKMNLSGFKIKMKKLCYNQNGNIYFKMIYNYRRKSKYQF